MPFPTIHASLGQALAARGYAEPTPVQEAVLCRQRGRVPHPALGHSRRQHRGAAQEMVAKLSGAAVSREQAVAAVKQVTAHG